MGRGGQWGAVEGACNPVWKQNKEHIGKPKMTSLFSAHPRWLLWALHGDFCTPSPTVGRIAGLCGWNGAADTAKSHRSSLGRWAEEPREPNRCSLTHQALHVVIKWWFRPDEKQPDAIRNRDLVPISTI